MRSLAQLTAQARNLEDRLKQEATALAERLAAVQITLTRRATEEAPAEAPVAAPAAATEDAPAEAAAPAAPAAPKLFGSVTSQDLSDALAAQGLTRGQEEDPPSRADQDARRASGADPAARGGAGRADRDRGS